MSFLFGTLTFAFLLSFTFVTDCILETFRYSKDVSKLYQSTEEEFYFRPKLDRSPSIRGRYSLTSDKSYFHLWASRAEKTKKKVTEVTEIATEGNNFVAEMLRILEQEDWLSDVWF